MIHVAIVDDYEIVRRGLEAILDAEPDITVVAEAGTYEDALTEIPLSGADVAVLDVRLPDGDGVDLCRDLGIVAPGVRCVLLTAFADETLLPRAVEAGAAAFVTKTLDGGDIVGTVREVAAGVTLLDATTAQYVADRMDAGGPHLTPQERRVVALLSEGLTNRQIGAHLGLSEKTVKNYVSNVLAKLGMAHRSEVAVFGARLARDDRLVGAGR